LAAVRGANWVNVMGRGGAIGAYPLYKAQVTSVDM
jgi:hypothetical protein